MHAAVWNYWKSHGFDELLKRTQASESFQSGFFLALEAMPESDWGAVINQLSITFQGRIPL